MHLKTYNARVNEPLSQTTVIVEGAALTSQHVFNKDDRSHLLQYYPISEIIIFLTNKEPYWEMLGYPQDET